MSQLSFEHLLNLSFAFHLRRKTGEILRILDRGAAINRAFELLLFNVIPTFIDIAVALVLFCVYFEWTLALVVFIVMAAYGACSRLVTGGWRGLVDWLMHSSICERDPDALADEVAEADGRPRCGACALSFRAWTCTEA